MFDRWHLFDVLTAIAQWMTGLVLFLVWLAVVILFVRFLLIATRAAKAYLRNQGEYDGVWPRAAAPAPTAPAPAAPAPAAAKPAPRPRTPKSPPAN